MSVRRPFGDLPAALFVFLLLVQMVFAEKYQDTTRHFAVQLPEGWSRKSPEEIASLNQEARKRMPRLKILYLDGFELDGSQHKDGMPYILLQWEPLKPTTTYEDIERSLQSYSAQAASVRAKIPDQIKDLAVGQAALDRNRNRMVARTQMKGPDEATIQSLMIGFLGKEGIVYLHCYDSDARFASMLPIFERIADSFSFDTGYHFTPGTPVNWQPILVILGGIAGLLGGVIGLIVGWRRKRRLRET